jgi:hypothetical protein
VQIKKLSLDEFLSQIELFYSNEQQPTKIEHAGLLATKFGNQLLIESAGLGGLLISLDQSVL